MLPPWGFRTVGMKNHCGAPVRFRDVFVVRWPLRGNPFPLLCALASPRFRLARTCKTISLMRGVHKNKDFSVMQGGQTEWRWFFRYFCGHRYPVNRCRLPFRKTHTSVNSAQPTAPPPFRLAG